MKIIHIFGTCWNVLERIYYQTYYKMGKLALRKKEVNSPKKEIDKEAILKFRLSQLRQITKEEQERDRLSAYSYL